MVMNMTEQQKEALRYIESQLECGYIDIGGAHEECEIEIIKEAIGFWKFIDEWNGIGCTSFQVTAEELNELLERQKKKEIIGLDQRITIDTFSSEFGKPFKIILRGDLKDE